MKENADQKALAELFALIRIYERQGHMEKVIAIQSLAEQIEQRIRNSEDNWINNPIMNNNISLPVNQRPYR